MEHNRSFRISFDGSFFLLCIPVLFFVPIKWVVSWVVAAVIHEVGHLIALKMLFRYLKNEERIPVDITEVMDSPRLWKILPDFLTEQEVGRLLNSFSTRDKDPLEFRNRVILELLYSSGLRASEAATLPLRAIDFEEEVLRVEGKGAKVRIVPVGKPALRLRLRGFWHIPRRLRRL